jgi:hypothetical protein
MVRGHLENVLLILHQIISTSGPLRYVQPAVTFKVRILTNKIHAGILRHFKNSMYKLTKNYVYPGSNGNEIKVREKICSAEQNLHYVVPIYTTLYQSTLRCTILTDRRTKNIQYTIFSPPTYNTMTKTTWLTRRAGGFRGSHFAI